MRWCVTRASCIIGWIGLERTTGARTVCKVQYCIHFGESRYRRVRRRWGSNMLHKWMSKPPSWQIVSRTHPDMSFAAGLYAVKATFDERCCSFLFFYMIALKRQNVTMGQWMQCVSWFFKHSELWQKLLL